MVKRNQDFAWFDLKPKERKRVASTLMNSVDNIGAIVASSLVSENIEHCSTSSIGMIFIEFWLRKFFNAFFKYISDFLVSISI